MSISLRTVLLACLAVVGVVLNGCVDRDPAPTEPGQQNWTVSGKTYVVGSRDPIGGVIVRCARVSSTSDVDGSYQLRGIPGGTQTLTAGKSGAENYSVQIEVTADMTYFVFIDDKTTNLSGYVTNAVDGPVKGAKVIISDLVGYTDISGHYQFYKVPRRSDTLVISHPSYLMFKTAISLTTPDMTFDAVLKRDSVIAGRVSAYNYVDQSIPSGPFPVYPNLEHLSLRANGNDSLGVYHGGIERNIFVTIIFPLLLTDDRVTLLEGNLQLCTDGPYRTFGIQTYAIRSSWAYSVTYNTQPVVGPILYSSFGGDSLSGKYCTVLGTDGLNVLLADYRKTGVIFGVKIIGGTVYPVGFYSSYATQNQPKLTYRVRY